MRWLCNCTLKMTGFTKVLAKLAILSSIPENSYFSSKGPNVRLANWAAYSDHMVLVSSRFT